jgi:anaerobic ribonucleoside-triphosphate reductase
VLLILSERREEDLVENSDISLIDYISNLPDNNEYWTIKKLTNMFKEALQSDEDWLNERWLGRALKRLNLVKQKRRQHKGREVILNIQKAKEKIRMFK